MTIVFVILVAIILFALIGAVKLSLWSLLIVILAVVVAVAILRG